MVFESALVKIQDGNPAELDKIEKYSAEKLLH